jgi:hypothetical protein
MTGFTDEFSSVAAYERIDRDVLQRRLLLALFALGTNMGIRAIVATGEHGESEAALRLSSDTEVGLFGIEVGPGVGGQVGFPADGH